MSAEEHCQSLAPAMSNTAERHCFLPGIQLQPADFLALFCLADHCQWGKLKDGERVDSVLHVKLKINNCWRSIHFSYGRWLSNS